MKRPKRSGRVGPSATYQYQDGHGRTNAIRITTKWRDEIDYHKLSRALLLFLEQEEQRLKESHEQAA